MNPWKKAWGVSLAVLAGVMCAIPVFGIDLSASRSVYHDGFNQQSDWAQNAHTWGEQPLKAVFWSGLVLLVFGGATNNTRNIRSGIFLLAMVAFIPGMLVQSLKSAFGRPRPVQTTEFGGRYDYHEWFAADYVGGGDARRSFPSGHAASAAGLLSFFWLLKKNRLRVAYLAFALLWWAYVSWGRVLIGAHFVSDTVGSLFLTLLIGGVLAWWLKPGVGKR